MKSILEYLVNKPIKNNNEYELYATNSTCYIYIDSKIKLDKLYKSKLLWSKTFFENINNYNLLVKKLNNIGYVFIRPVCMKTTDNEFTNLSYSQLKEGKTPLHKTIILNSLTVDFYKKHGYKTSM